MAKKDRRPLGNKNKRTRRNFQTNQSLIDESKAADERDKTKQPESSLPNASTSLSETPTATRRTPDDKAKKKREFGAYIMWTLAGIRRGITSLFRVLDKHDGSITALATVAIVGLTFVYVRYSKKQWETMNGQLTQMQSQTRAWLGIVEENGLRADPMTLDSRNNLNATCNITVTNYGNYPAQHLMPFCQLMVLQGNIQRVHEKIRELCRERTPTFGGSILFQGQKDTWEWGATVTNSQMMRDAAGGPFYVFLIGSITYRDQFDAAHCTAYGFKRNVPGRIDTVSFQLTPNTTIPGQWVRWDGVVDPK